MTSTALGTDRGLDLEGPVLVVEGVSKSYGAVQALEGVTLSLHKGETLGIIGPNGAGKTTLARLVVGLDSPDSGVIRYQPRPDGHARRTLGYAPQQTGLYRSLSVYENLEFFYALARHSGAGRASIGDLLDELGIGDYAAKKVAWLSGGQQRLVHVAVALLANPEILILDEPTVGADVIVRSNLLSRLSRYVTGGGSLIYTSHYLSEFEALANLRLAFLISGSLREVGTIEELVDRVSPEVSRTGKHAKDLGSFAVFCTLAAAGLYIAYVMFF